MDEGLGARRRLAAFTRVLRDNGFIAGLAEARDALVILADDTAARPALLRAALRGLFCSRLSDWQRFDEIFDAFWLERGMRSAARVFGTPPQAPPGRSLMPGGTPAGDDAVPNRTERGEAAEASGGSGRRAGASTAETLERTDFRHVTDPDELLATHALAARLARAMRARRTRRERASRRGARLDLRATIHHSVARGGTMLDLVHCRRRPKPLRLALLLDASGSMSLYTTVFVRFMHGMLACFREAEIFVFHTRLVHVTPALRERDAGRAVERLALIAQGVGGGTRIGESLQAFDRWHAKRVLRGRSALIIVSDGYDTGPPEALGRAMAALRRRCRRVVWLNPMLGWEGYAPEARGMAAALPYVDLFAPAHNLESLAALEPYLARI